jgi:hypothetical protein
VAITKEEERRKTKAGPLLLFFGLGGVFAGVAYALKAKAAPKTPNLTGTVTDMVTGRPIPGVLVSLDSKQTLTDNSGKYSFADLTAGTYTVLFVKSAYADESFPGFNIVAGDNKFDVQMLRISLPVVDSGGVSTGGAKRRLSRYGGMLYNTYLKKVDGDDEVFVATSQDEGANWSPWQVTGPSSPGPGSKGQPSIAVDGNGDLSIVYRYAGNVYYDVPGLGPQRVNDAADDLCRGGPIILIDSNTLPHIFSLSDRGHGTGEWGQIFVRHAQNPPIWSKTDITGIGTGGGGSVRAGDFDVAINSEDKIELIWYCAVNGGMGVGWNARCFYVGSKGEVFLTNLGGSMAGHCGVVVDSGDNLFLRWENVVQFFGASLGPEEDYLAGGSQVGIAATRGDALYAVWSQNGAPNYPQRRNLYIRRRGSGQEGMWQGGDFLTDVEDDNDDPCLLWAKNPGSCVMSDYAVTWKREAADQILFGSPEFFAMMGA